MVNSILVNGVIVSVFCSCVATLVHVVLCYFSIVKKEFKSPVQRLVHHMHVLLIIWLSLMPLFVFIFFGSSQLEILTKFHLRYGQIISFIYGVILFLMLFLLYLSFYYVVDRSISSRLMIGIEDAPGRKVTFKQLKEIFNIDEKYMNEINGMLECGFLKKNHGHFRTTFKGMCYAKLARFLKWIYRFGPGGF